MSLRIPFLGSEISGVISIHTKLYLSKFLQEKKSNEKKNYSTQVSVRCWNWAPPYQYNLEEMSQILVFLLLFSTVTVLCLAIVLSHKLIAYIIKNEGFVRKIYCIAKDSFTEVMHH